MQWNNTYRDKVDDFSRQVKQKIENHSLPPNASVWESVQRSLPMSEKKPLRKWILWTSVAAAAIIGLFLLLNNPTAPTKSDVKMTESKPTEVRETVETLSVNPSSSEKKSIIQKKRKKDRQIMQAIPIAKKTIDTEKEKIVITRKEIYPETENKEKDKPTPITHQNATEKNMRTNEQFGETWQENRITSSQPMEKKSKKKQKIRLFAALGAVSSANLENMYDGDMAKMDAPIIPNSDKFYEDVSSGGEVKNYTILKPKDYSDIRHLPPLSASAMAEFPIDSTWSIETGLTYTYLASKFKKSGTPSYEGKLHLHYLGIPLHVKANVMQSENWNIYFLAGGSVEKGLRSIYKQKISASSGRTIHTNVRSKIDGFQFSATVAAGFDYKINEKMRLFAEPKITYYFKNNQPMSTRTESPFTVGMNGGIRIQF